MISLLTLMLMGGVDVAEAHSPHKHHRPRVVRQHRLRPPPPPSAAHGHRVKHHRSHWIYPHANAKYVWKWTSPHYNRRGQWVPGYWSVVLRF